MTDLKPGPFGRPLTAAEFMAHTPEKLELLSGEIPEAEALLLLLLTQFGLRRAAEIVGRERWRAALEDDRG